MPRDTTGAFTLPEAPFVPNTLADPQAVNNQLAAIAAGLTDSLSRSGAGAMLADLPMGGKKVTGLAAGTAPTDGANTGQVSDVQSAVDTLAGGIEAQMPRDGSRAATGPQDMGGQVLRNASGVQVALGNFAAEAPLHIRSPDLGAAAGSGQTVASLATWTGAQDRILVQAARDAAGGTASLSLRRATDTTPKGGVVFTASGGVGLSAIGQPLFLVDGDGSVQLGGAQGLVNAAAANPVQGATFYAPATGPGGVLHMACQFPPGTGQAMVLGRNNGGYLAAFFAGGAFIGGIEANTSGGTAYNTASDRRLKQDVTRLPNALPRVLALRPCEFAYRASPDRRLSGFLADEVQRIVPEAVTGEPGAHGADGAPAYQGLDHGRLVPLLVAAVQVLAGRVAALEAAQQ